MINNPWVFGWTSLDVIASTILSVLLICFTIRISRQQNRQQRDIADRDVRVQNYQHRAKCYLQIVEASTILTRGHAFNIANIITDKPIDPQEISRLNHGQQLMLKTQLESKLLFSPELTKTIYALFDIYVEYFQETAKILINQQKTQEFLKDIDIEEIISAHKHPEVLQRIEKVDKRLSYLIQLEGKLSQLFKSKEFNDLLLKETKVE